MNTFNIGCLFWFDEYALENFSNRKDIIAYGGVNCLWHGGRTIQNNYSIEEIDSIISSYNNNGIPCRFAFSNHKITEEDLNDHLSNDILDILSKNEMNGVIISSDLLYDYIRAKYPKMKIICSVIKTCIETDNWRNETPDIYNELCQKYDCVVLNQSRNTDLEFLSKLKHKDKIEILLNSRCIRFCKNSAKHYSLLADIIKEDSTKCNCNESNDCLNSLLGECFSNKYSLKYKNCYLNIEEYKKLVEMGFNQFKIEGRGVDLDLFSKDLDYFINENEPCINNIFDMINNLLCL